MFLVEGLDPIIDDKSRILILGSMPSVRSLEEKKYYANPRNQFWRILFSVFDLNLAASYDQKIALVKEKRIALWDVIRSCDREGSSDSKITNVIVNDFTDFLTDHPEIKHVYFNGQKAFNIFQKKTAFNPSSRITLRALPSTSPANTKSLESKINEWAIIRITQ